MVAQKTIVHVSDAKVSRGLDDVIITYSLGSCIGVSLYDPAIHVGGMLHYQLPDSKLDPAKAQSNPFMFADSGMQLLVDKLVGKGFAVITHSFLPPGDGCLSLGQAVIGRQYLMDRQIRENQEV